MRLSTKGRYAITAMIDLAINATDGNKVTLADISEFEGISLSYLEQLFARLREAKLVQGTRGPGGGYRLGREASKISITEIIIAVDDKFDKGNPMGRVDARHQQTQDVWDKLSMQIQNYLGDITLGTLLEQSEASNTEQRTEEESAMNVWPTAPVTDRSTVYHR
ncbi:Rrf2 family transcriptional regulator [Pseudomonadota bacterium]